MFKHKQFLICIFLLMVITVGTYGLSSQYLGYWENVDSNTKSITSFYLNPGIERNEYDFHAYASCSPKDCDWEHTQLFVYGTNVSNRSHEYATAVYKTNFNSTIVILKFMNDGRIFLEGFTQFTDNSNRSNYYFYDTFVKVSDEVEDLAPKCADLVIGSIYSVTIDKKKIQITARVDIKNIGEGQSGVSIASLTDKTNKAAKGYKNVSTERVKSLAPGETTTVTFTINYGRVKINPKMILEAEADTNRQVDECNENNNKKTYRN